MRFTLVQGPFCPLVEFALAKSQSLIHHALSMANILPVGIVCCVCVNLAYFAEKLSWDAKYIKYVCNDYQK